MNLSTVSAKDQTDFFFFNVNKTTHDPQLQLHKEPQNTTNFKVIIFQQAHL